MLLARFEDKLNTYLERNRMEKKKEKKSSALARRVRGPQEKEGFRPRKQAVMCDRSKYLARSQLHISAEHPTLWDYYNDHLLELQNERQWEEETCKAYDRAACTLIAPFFSDCLFRDLTELDYLTVWDKITQVTPNGSRLESAITLLRILVDFAFKRKDIYISLWGIRKNLEDLIRDKRKPARVVTDNERAGQVKRRGLRIARSLPIEAEFRLLLRLLDDVPHHGEALGGLIVFLTGARTSEATALNYGHLSELAPDIYVFQRVDVSLADSRETEAGGKSGNAIRLLWVPDFLAKLLLERREHLESIYGPQKVAGMPIVCRGTDYKERATQKEFNREMRRYYQEVEVGEDLISDCFEILYEDADIARDCENDLTVYLGRHQTATALVYCGLEEEEIFYCMGHAQQDDRITVTDYNNPDKFRDLVRKLSRRPVVQMLNHEMPCVAVDYCSGPMSYTADCDLQMHFAETTEFALCARALEPGMHIKYQADNVEISQEVSMLWDAESTATLSLRNALYQQGRKAYERALAAIDPAKADDAITSATGRGVDIDYDGDYQFDIVESTPAPVVGKNAETLPSFAAIASPPSVASAEYAAPSLYAPTRPAPKSHSAEPTQCRYAGGGNIYFQYDSTFTEADRELRVLANRGNRGNKVVPIDKKWPNGLHVQHAGMNSFFLSADGTLFKIPDENFFDNPATCADLPFVSQISGDGIWLEFDPMQRDVNLICVTTTGRLVCVSGDVFVKRFLAEGKKLVTLSDGRIAAACITPAEKDVLLISRMGRALRISGSSLMPHSNTPLTPISGMTLDEGDAIVSCIPCTAPSVLCVTAFGQVAHTSLQGIMPHGRGSSGIVLVKLAPHDRLVAALPVSEALVLLRNDGYFVCLDTQNIRQTGRNTSGVVATKLRAGAEVICAAGLCIEG